MKALRRGIIARIPSKPPKTDTTMTRWISMSKPSNKSAGMVTPTPKAMDSPADPAVCTMLFSRMVACRILNSFERALKRVIAKTETGMEAETVIPTLRTR